MTCIRVFIVSRFGLVAAGFFYPWSEQPYQVYDENTNRVALRRRLPQDDAWVVPHNLYVSRADRSVFGNLSEAELVNYMPSDSLCEFFLSCDVPWLRCTIPAL